MKECGYFPSDRGDRKYGPEDQLRLFSFMITDGVFKNYAIELYPSTTTASNQMKVGRGAAFYNRIWFEVVTDETVSFPGPDSTYYRKDTIVIEFNKTNAVRDAYLKVVKGNPSTSASNVTNPTLTNTSTIKQIPIATVLRRPNVNVIAENDVTRMVGTVANPYVANRITN